MPSLACPPVGLPIWPRASLSAASMTVRLLPSKVPAPGSRPVMRPAADLHPRGASYDCVMTQLDDAQGLPSVSAALLQLARLKAGLSQRELAEQAGVPVTMIS